VNETHENWSIEQSAKLYRISDWGADYFGINSQGHVTVRPDPNGPSVDLYDLVRSLEKRGVDAPILFRFDGIIRHRISIIQEAFDAAISAWNYTGRYRLAFPLKVNPQGQVIETIRRGFTDKSGRPCHINLEVGSKPELLAALSLPPQPDSVLLCNGYKDDEYIELALIGRKLGIRTIIIVEQFYELSQIIVCAKRLNVEPEIGLRMKPYSKAGGLWESSSGDKAKFGLNAHQILRAISLLNEEGLGSWLVLLHFHIGSQIPSIVGYRRVLREATRMYVEVAKRCPSLTMLDVGGGLGVDYDGSSSNFESSMNYSINEYAESIVSSIFEACEEAGVRQPDLFSESGRALVAHHAILVTEVIDMAPGFSGPKPTKPCPFDSELARRVHELYFDLSPKNVKETLNEVVALKEEILQQFVLGKIDLEERAFGESILRATSAKLVEMSATFKYIPEELKRLEDSLRDTYFCNFSLFQSMLDSWAIDQLFPIMPLQRLMEEPQKRATLADLTCDSDGEITRFIDLKDVNNFLPCHEPESAGGYYIGVFLVGAYQEILGGLHNLFGDTNAVHVDVGEGGSIEIGEIVVGDTIREVLEYVEYNLSKLTSQFRSSLEMAIRQNNLTPEESARYQKKYRDVLEGYTYLVK
jgi:arginine decarboxylase